MTKRREEVLRQVIEEMCGYPKVADGMYIAVGGSGHWMSKHEVIEAVRLFFNSQIEPDDANEPV